MTRGRRVPMALAGFALLGVACRGSASGDAPNAAPLLSDEPPFEPASSEGADAPGAGHSLRVVELSSAGDITFALLSDGTVRAWGKPSESQLDAVSLTFDAKLEHDIPVALEGLTSVRQVSTGTSHTCVLGQDNVVRCWGLSVAGSLGNGLVRNHLDPQPITDGEGIAEVRADDRLCVRYLTGEARCLGDKGVVKPVPSLGAVQRMSGYNGHGAGRGCAIRTNGTVACWGLVFGRDMPIETYWDQYTGNDRPDLYHAYAVEVRGLTGVRALSLAFSHVCAIAQGDALYCWGVGGDGELGTGKSSDSRESTSYQEFSPKRVVDLPPVEAVSAGGGFTCAVTTEGDAWCWGRNDRGQLGLGDTKPRVRATLVPGVDRLVQIAAGMRHACALRSDGAVFCWGDNQVGETGTGGAGPDRSVLTPTRVTGLD